MAGKYEPGLINASMMVFGIWWQLVFLFVKTRIIWVLRWNVSNGSRGYFRRRDTFPFNKELHGLLSAECPGCSCDWVGCADDSQPLSVSAWFPGSLLHKLVTMKLRLKLLAVFSVVLCGTAFFLLTCLQGIWLHFLKSCSWDKAMSHY